MLMTGFTYKSKLDLKSVLRKQKLDLRRYYRKVAKHTADGIVKEIQIQLLKGKHNVTGQLSRSVHRKPSKGGWVQNVLALHYLLPMSKGSKPHPLPKSAFWHILYAVRLKRYGRHLWYYTTYQKAYHIWKHIWYAGTKPTGVLDKVRAREEKIVRRAIQKAKREVRKYGKV